MSGLRAVARTLPNRARRQESLGFHVWMGAFAIYAASAGMSGPLIAQNLVQNPSFETNTQCPSSYDQLSFAPAWSKPTAGSPDYYNACAGSPAVMGVPANDLGSQAPHSGNAYAGFILRPSNANYREYVQAPLTAPLVANVSYHVEFYVSLSDQSKWAVDKIGAYLSVGAVGPVNNALPLPFVPQVEHPHGSFITNKTGWTLVSGTYVAAGGEDHIVVGNFYNDANSTTTIGLGGFYIGSYYYIDDVSVSALDCVPLPDGSDCSEGGCNSGAACRPSQVIHNPSNGEILVTECGCDCFMRRNDVPPFEPLFCTGGVCANTGEACQLTSTPNTDGTTTYDCCAEPAPCQPNAARTACGGDCPSVACPANPPGTTAINACGALEDGVTAGCVIFRSQGNGPAYEVLNPSALLPFGIGDKLRVCGFISLLPTSCQQGTPINVTAAMACDAGENCQPRCLRQNLTTGQTEVLDCECRGPEPCRAVLGGEGVECVGRCPSGKGCHRTQTLFTEPGTSNTYLDVCCDCEDVCPLPEPPVQFDPCRGFAQAQYCVDGEEDDVCVPHCAALFSNDFCPPIPPNLTNCDCACTAPGECGPVKMTGVGQPYYWNNLPYYYNYLFECEGECSSQKCELFHKSWTATTYNSTGGSSALATQLPAGFVKCDCDGPVAPSCAPNASGSACVGACASGLACEPTAYTCGAGACAITGCACAGGACRVTFPPPQSGPACRGTCDGSLSCALTVISNLNGSTSYTCDCSVQHGNGDTDRNGVVDLRDYRTFQNCFGIAQGQTLGACNFADMEPDGDVDLADFARIHAGIACGP